MIYIIMRVSDNSKTEQDLNLEMLETYTVYDVAPTLRHGLN
jgi:hypothetical protein